MNKGLTSFRALAFFAIFLYHINPGPGYLDYGLYVFHFPVVWLVYNTMYRLPVIAQQSISLVITVIISAASYEYMEKPMIDLKDRFFARGPAGKATAIPVPD